jgi:phage tail-like protein
MSDPSTIPQLPNDQNPPLDCYFMVVFFIGGTIPNPLDIRFQSVSGINSTINTEDISEGGENLFKHKLPTKMSYGELTLKRGLVIGSPLNIEFNIAMSLMKFSPSNVLVMLLNADDVPIASWLFLHAYPTKWEVSDLNADSGKVAIDTMTLTYNRFQHLRI